MFDNGISAYIHAQAVVDVYFPIDAKGNEYICCEQCEFFSTNTRRCGLTHKVSEFPNKYVGGNCPLEIKE